MNLGVKFWKAKTFHTNFTVISVKKRNVKFHARTLTRKHPHKRGAAPESGAAAAARPPGGSRLGRRAASALPRRMLPGSRAAAARPKRSIRCRQAAAAAVAAFKSLFVVTQISWLPLQTRCRTHAAALLAFVMSEALGSRPAPGTPSAKRSVGTRRAASMWDTLSEGTARAAQLAPSAVTASAVGGSATRGVVGRVSPTTSGSSRSTRDCAALERPPFFKFPPGVLEGVGAKSTFTSLFNDRHRV